MSKRKVKGRNQESKKSAEKVRDLTPEEIGDFLESFRKMIGHQDEPTQLISLRVPKNIIRAFKLRAQTDGKKYQSMIVQAMRDYLEKASGL